MKRETINVRRPLVFIALLALYVSHGTSLWAQFDFQAGIAPGDSYGFKDSTGPTQPVIDPFAQVLSDELLKTKTSNYWTLLDISTANPAQDLSLYMRRGLGRSELITLIMIADAGRQKLKEITQKRVRGARLRELALEYKLPYETMRLEANALKAKLLERMPINLENTTNEPRTSGTSTGTAKPGIK